MIIYMSPGFPDDVIPEPLVIQGDRDVIVKTIRELALRMEDDPFVVITKRELMERVAKEEEVDARSTIEVMREIRRRIKEPSLTLFEEAGDDDELYVFFHSGGDIYIDGEKDLESFYSETSKPIQGDKELIALLFYLEVKSEDFYFFIDNEEAMDFIKGGGLDNRPEIKSAILNAIDMPSVNQLDMN